MIDTIRLSVSSVLIWAGIHIAPRHMRPILTHMVKSFAGIGSEIQDGRTGGLILIPWSTTPEGDTLSLTQKAAAADMCAKVRQQFGSL